MRKLNEIILGTGLKKSTDGLIPVIVLSSEDITGAKSTYMQDLQELSVRLDTITNDSFNEMMIPEYKLLHKAMDVLTNAMARNEYNDVTPRADVLAFSFIQQAANDAVELEQTAPAQQRKLNIA